LAAERSLALRDFDAAVLQKLEYESALSAAFDPTQPVPCYATLPQHPSMRYSKRRRFPVKGNNFTFMRRAQSRVIAEWTLELLKENEFASYIQGPQGVGKSHMLYEAALLLGATPGCRVVYEHDCASWAFLSGQPVQATLYFLRTVAMAFAGDAEVLQLCRDTIGKVAIVSSAAEAEKAVCGVFLPQLGDLCKRFGLQLFFVFDQHNSLTPEMRASFPFSLPEAGLLCVSQLRGVAMVVISASANNEYYLKVASEQPSWPQIIVTDGFRAAGSPSELDVFLQENDLFPDASLADIATLRYETNCSPLELSYVVETRDMLREAALDVSFDAVMNAYIGGCKQPNLRGRRTFFGLLVRKFDDSLSRLYSNTPQAREQHVNSIICMKLQLPLSSFPGEVLLNLQLCYLSDVPFGQFDSAPSLLPLNYIHPITPVAGAAASSSYLFKRTVEAKMNDTFRYVFESPIIETPVRGLMLQRYLIQRLERANGVALRTRRYKSNHTLGRSSEIVLVRRQLRKVEWNGNSVPQTTLSRTEDLLLVPLSQNYPGVDFLIWAAKPETLYLFQVTLSPVGRHSSNFWEGGADLEQQWGAKLNMKRLERVWITPNADAGPVSVERSHQGQLVCSLADALQSNGGAMFPLLQSWSPASERS
jgi:hypothetical protein